MALVKRNHSDLPGFPSWFDNLWSRDLMDWSNWNFSPAHTTLPAANIKENNDEYEIELAAPGMKKEDFKINLDNNLLTISSEKQEDKEEKNKDYSRREFHYQSFQRSFTLPERDVDQEKVSAKYHDGILSIHIPKREEAKAKPVREIKIS